MLEATSRRAAKEGLRNVRPVLGVATDPRLPGPVDAVLIVDTYHEMEDPVTLLGNVRRALKPSGRVGIVDYKKDGYGPGPPLEERTDPEVIVRDARCRRSKADPHGDLPPLPVPAGVRHRPGRTTCRPLTPVACCHCVTLS